jgi:hypothetical protein
MDPALRHSAGATVTHRHPFESLDVPVIVEFPPQEIVDKWVRPLYMKLLSPGARGDEVFDLMVELWSDMTEGLARGLLGYFNWRMRIVGAYLAALKELRSLTQLIGRLLLRSDVCYAGRGYCVALARFSTPESTGFLLEYLDYYLTRHDLWFDQNWAMGAIGYLDSRDGTSNLESMMQKWTAFIGDKPHSDLKKSLVAFDGVMAKLEAVSARCIGPASGSAR